MKLKSVRIGGEIADLPVGWKWKGNIVITHVEIEDEDVLMPFANFFLKVVLVTCRQFSRYFFLV